MVAAILFQPPTMKEQQAIFTPTLPIKIGDKIIDNFFVIRVSYELIRLIITFQKKILESVISIDENQENYLWAIQDLKASETQRSCNPVYHLLPHVE